MALRYAYLPITRTTCLYASAGLAKACPKGTVSKRTFYFHIESFSSRRRFDRRRRQRQSTFSAADENKSFDNTIDTSSNKTLPHVEADFDTSSNKTLPLHDAAERGDHDKIKFLVSERLVGVDLKDPGRSNATALHIASRSGHVNIVKFLVESGAEVNSKGPWDMTPLMYSVIFHRKAIAQYLLENGADPRIEDSRGRTALVHAVNEKQTEIEHLIQSFLKG